MFGNLGVTELIIIMVVILLLFGAKRIPEIAGSMGKGIREFKKNLNDATQEIRLLHGQASSAATRHGAAQASNWGKALPIARR